MKRPKILFVKKIFFFVYRHSVVNSGNSGVNKMLNYGSGKRYVVQIYEIKLHNKNNVDWIKIIYKLIPGS